jgi:uncharacterized protein YutE (UPF0331/DUF86 family)
MADDTLLNKCAIIERCLQRIEQDYIGFEDQIESDFMRQDAVVLNIQRACEASIDLAMHVVRWKKLGLPRESRGAFELLKTSNFMEKSLAEKMMKMVEFRNLAVHNYKSINIEVVHSIITKHLDDFRQLVKWSIHLNQQRLIKTLCPSGLV